MAILNLPFATKTWKLHGIKIVEKNEIFNIIIFKYNAVRSRMVEIRALYRSHYIYYYYYWTQQYTHRSYNKLKTWDEIYPKRRATHATKKKCSIDRTMVERLLSICIIIPSLLLTRIGNIFIQVDVEIPLEISYIMNIHETRGHILEVFVALKITSRLR